MLSLIVQEMNELEARIHELDNLEAYYRRRYHEALERISKAKEILELLFAYETEAIPLTDYSVPKMVERTLEALEGK